MKISKEAIANVRSAIEHLCLAWDALRDAEYELDIEIEVEHISSLAGDCDAASDARDIPASRIRELIKEIRKEK